MIGYVVIQDLKCPICSGNLHVTNVACSTCRIEIKGEFRSHWLAGLDGEQLDFLLTFVRCRGVLRDMESVLGISYPTVRNRVDQLVHSVEQLLGDVQEVTTPPNPRIAVLNRLAAGEISPDRAMTLLDALTH